jgi:hypothetical protein
MTTRPAAVDAGSEVVSGCGIGPGSNVAECGRQADVVAEVGTTANFQDAISRTYGGRKKTMQ